mgnify:CR=1 FL=1
MLRRLLMNGRGKKIAAIGSIVLLLCILWIPTPSANFPTMPLTVYGKVFDKHGHAIGNVEVTLTNINTGETHVNSSPITATSGYQFNLGNFDLGWEKGHVLHLYGSYNESGHTYIEEYEFPIPMNINESGYAMRRPLHLETCIDCDDDEDDNGQLPEKPDHYYINGIIYKQDSEPASGAVVVIENLRTNDTRSNVTTEMGQYSFDLLFLNNGWELNDRIRINATYGTGENYQVGSYVFSTRIGQKGRNIDVQMYNTFAPQVPDTNETDNDTGKTKEEWIEEYYTLLGQYNQSQDQIEQLEEEIEELENTSSTNQTTNQTADDWKELKWENDRLRRTVADNNTIIIMLALISIFSIIYIIWRNDLIAIPFIGKYSERR